jgi:hypothetical protein
MVGQLFEQFFRRIIENEGPVPFSQKPSMVRGLKYPEVSLNILKFPEISSNILKYPEIS